MIDEIEEIADVDVDGWIFTPAADDSEATIWFAHSQGQPVPFGELQKIDDVYGISSIESESNGRTGSRLRVDLANVTTPRVQP